MLAGCENEENKRRTRVGTESSTIFMFITRAVANRKNLERGPSGDLLSASVVLQRHNARARSLTTQRPEQRDSGWSRT